MSSGVIPLTPRKAQDHLARFVEISTWVEGDKGIV